MKDTYAVERSIEIVAPAVAVQELLVDFRRWSAWSPFEDLDPGMRRTYDGAEVGVGAIYEWSGNLKAGSGQMEITEVVPERRVVIDQQNLKPFRSTSTVTFSLAEAEGRTTLVWSTVGRSLGVSRALGRLVPMDKVLGPVVEQGLSRLKAVVEASSA